MAHPNMEHDSSTKMKIDRPSPTSNAAPRALLLWGVLAVQLFCALFFIADVIRDLVGAEESAGGSEGHIFEFFVVLALALGVVITGVEIRRVLRRQGRIQQQLLAASGAFADILEMHFSEWALTPSERDVALFAIKGLSIADMAAMRGTRVGTIKAQCNAIYAKAGVSGRQQLLSVFVEELMGEGLPGGLPSDSGVSD